MARRLGRFSLVVFLFAAALPAAARAQGGNVFRNDHYVFGNNDTLVITRVTVDQGTRRITIVGEDLARSYRQPTVSLAGSRLRTISSSETQVVAEYAGTLGPGTYLLVVSNGPDRNERDSIDVSIGGGGSEGPAGPTGPMGPAGPMGPTGPQGTSGPQGPAGPAGPQGIPGAVGPQGPAGPSGPEGPAGPAGPGGPQGQQGASGLDGSQGPSGPQGPQGAQGPAGPTSFAGVLTFEAAPLTTLNTTVSQPSGCVSDVYVAGANEVAIISLDVTARPTSTNSMYLSPMASADGGAPGFLTRFFAVQQLSTNAFASLHTQAALDLAEGVSYRFYSGLRADSAVAMSQFTCRGVVTVFRR